MKRTAQGYFITFEGIEGSGKSTQAALLDKFLSDSGINSLYTREPGGTEMGQKIREILLKPGNTISPLTELLLFAADRSHHVSTVIKPALQEGNIVICDRFTDATLAYQGYARKIDMNIIGLLNNIAVAGVKPDLTFLVDLPVSEGLGRAIRRNEEENVSEKEGKFEQELESFHEKVRKGYLELANKEKDRFKIIDGNRPIDIVFEDIIRTIKLMEIIR